MEDVELGWKSQYTLPFKGQQDETKTTQMNGQFFYRVDHNFFAGHEYDLEREFYIIHVKESIWDETTSGTVYISVLMKYTARMNDNDNIGFSRSKYTDQDGVERYMFTSQFQVSQFATYLLYFHDQCPIPEH